MVFKFIDFNFDSKAFTLEMEYGFSHLDFNFKEVLDFSIFRHSQVDTNQLYEAFKILFLVSGISYYKLYACKKIDLGSLRINQTQAEFLNFFYKNGLSEFIYKNKLDFIENVPDFTAYASDGLENESFDIDLKDRSLLAWGGGKDSIVSSIILDRLAQNYDLFSVKSDRIKENTAKVNGNEFFEVKRKLDPRLSEFNNFSDTYNGHVPITGILAFIKVVVALMNGYKNIVLSNEFSSDEGNLEYQGCLVNHQFSKGSDFEYRINSYIHNFIHKDLNYFSLLRPFYELKIASIFANEAEDYLPVFSSCNRNFHYDDNKNLKNKVFCGECEKCAFVFLILAPFLSRDRLVKIFGEDLFLKNSLELVYYELCGLGSKKPFECVGTFEECKAAFSSLKSHKDWQGHSLVIDLNGKIEFKDLNQFMVLQNEYNFNKNWYLKIKDEFA
mgnify:CR=1 FL=1